jgi:hypothetical protein
MARDAVPTATTLLGMVAFGHPIYGGEQLQQLHEPRYFLASVENQ